MCQRWEGLWRLPQRAPFYNASDLEDSKPGWGVFFATQRTLSSISQPLVHNVLQRLTLLKPAILLTKRSASPESASRTCGPPARRQQDIRAFTADVPPSGSCSNTSNPAPLIRLAVSARSSAGSSMTDPHPTLITTAVGFITADTTSLVMCFVSSVNGAVATMLSLECDHLPPFLRLVEVIHERISRSGNATNHPRRNPSRNTKSLSEQTLRATC
jgi:hypothetical protein